MALNKEFFQKSINYNLKCEKSYQYLAVYVENQANRMKRKISE